jgi:aerobic-type carbon monoxide dehydrogenase small subunit (CoxS/CutS family)
VRIELTLNGAPVGIDVDPLRRLLDFLREERSLTGAKEGCGEGECGSCSVIVDDLLALSCLIPMGQLHGATVLTIEGLAAAQPSGLTALQEAMVAAGGIQCGICTPGIVMAAHALLAARPHPSVAEIREALAGNLCRCTGYTAIERAVLQAAAGGRPEGQT